MMVDCSTLFAKENYNFRDDWFLKGFAWQATSRKLNSFNLIRAFARDRYKAIEFPGSAKKEMILMFLQNHAQEIKTNYLNLTCKIVLSKKINIH